MKIQYFLSILLHWKLERNHYYSDTFKDYIQKRTKVIKKKIYLSAIFLFLLYTMTGCSQMQIDQLNKQLETAYKTEIARYKNILVVQDAVYTPDQPVLMIILDASGSMNQRDKSNVVKIDAAKQVVADIVSQLDTNKTSVGLMAFNQGCNSTRLYVEPTNKDPYRVNAVVQTMKAHDGTPLATSIRKAGEILSQSNQKVRLLIVSDGEESCGGNPVYEAQRLMQAYNIEPTIYVVGYNVDKRSRSQLEEIANIGKGEYFDVQDSVTLGKMLNNIVFSSNIKKQNFSSDGNIYKFNINFDTGSDIIKAEYYDDINTLTKYLVMNNFNAQIQGHTDNVGNKSYNKNLSQRRAKAVANKLLENGVDPSRLSFAGYGDEFPLQSNATSEGRYVNRRVEAHIIKSSK